MNDDKLQSILEWIRGQIDTTPFGEVGINLIIHEGQIRRIEKRICEKAQ